MSIRVMAEVWERSRHAGTNLLMMLALADFSDDQGYSYPAVPTLAVKCRMQPRNATYILRELERSGELEVTPNGGPKGTNRYRIALEALRGVQTIAGGGMQHGAPLQGIAPLQSSASTPAIQRRLPLQPTADEPSLNRQEPSSLARKRAARTPNSNVLTVDALVAEGVERMHADGWMVTRKAKRAPLTVAVWEATKREAAAAGITPAKAVQVAAENGWQGFKATWFSNLQQQPQRRPGTGSLSTDHDFEKEDE